MLHDYRRRVLSRGLVVFLLLAGPAQARDKAKKNEKDAEHQLGTDSRRDAHSRLKDFHKDLGRNFLGLFSSKNLIPLALGGTAAAALEFDDDTASFFSSGRRFGKAESVLGGIPGNSLVIGGAVGTMILISQFNGSESFQELSYSLGQGFVLNGMMTFGLKKAVGRERPDGSNNRSFPSGHTSQAFTFATILAHYNKGAAVPAYIAAGFVGASRLDGNKHFLSDIIAGAALGYIVGRTVVREAEKKSRMTIQPYVSTSREEVGVSFRAVF